MYQMPIAETNQGERSMEMPSPHHQVFISFRGKDVRDNFFSFLKEKLIDKGVNVLTDEDAPRGKPIDENLLRLIKDSKVAVVIFSENYPESDWCLDELVEIKKQMDLKKLDPLPIFFAVETSHVKLEAHNPFKDILLRLEDNVREKAKQEGVKALEEAEKRFVSWRGALKSIAGRTGLTYKKKSNQAIFVRGIVEKVKEMLANVPSPDGVPQHQVFISFRGGDIRHNISSFIQHGLKRSGINFFIDVENRIGREDIDQLFIGIRESKIALVIITEDYLSSAWCLEELVEVNKCMEMNNLIVIPIFYRVSPSYIQHKRFLDQLVEIWGDTDARIERWRKALKSVVNLVGLASEQDTSDAELVEHIIQVTKKALAKTSSN